MNTATLPAATLGTATSVSSGDAAPAAQRKSVIVMDQIVIPEWVEDLESYRRWAHSDEYPTSGWVSFLDGDIWVDPSMEEFITHNRVKSAFSFRIMFTLQENPIGSFVGDRMLLSHSQANLSTEPDGLFYLWETMRSGRLRLIPGKHSGYMELEGTPDGVMEIISKTSQRKDKVVLRDLYWRVGVTEYWLIDARVDPPEFDILRHTATGYEPTPVGDGWQSSQVLGKQFRLVRSVDPLGHPQFAVEAR